MKSKVASKLEVNVNTLPCKIMFPLPCTLPHSLTAGRKKEDTFIKIFILMILSSAFSIFSQVSENRALTFNKLKTRSWPLFYSVRQNFEPTRKYYEEIFLTIKIREVYFQLFPKVSWRIWRQERSKSCKAARPRHFNYHYNSLFWCYFLLQKCRQAVINWAVWSGSSHFQIFSSH